MHLHRFLVKKMGAKESIKTTINVLSSVLRSKAAESFVSR